MSKVVQLLLFASRGLAVCAVLAGLGAGLLAYWASGLVCFDSCPTRASYFASLEPGTVRVLAPCVVLEALALAVFLAYCLATRQTRRAVISLLFLLVAGAVGVVALSALVQHAQATLPVWGGDAGDLLREAPLVAWTTQWGLALTLAAGVWSGIPALTQWRR